MLFINVSQIKDRTEKNIFIEYVDIYIRLVKCICEMNNICFVCNEDVCVVGELKDIGVINSSDEINNLKSVLKDKYFDFITSVRIVICNRELFGNHLVNLYNLHRKKLQSTIQSNKRIVDFFCGAGGLSLGFIQEGFNVALANDIESVCIQTYKFNHPELPSEKLIQGDIKDIVDNISAYIDCDIDVVVGGPPCQGFSEANRQRVIDDPRNKLYKYFVQAVGQIAPKFVVMENVKGMIKVAGQVVEDFERLIVIRDGGEYKYKVGYKVLNSQYFSVAQSRERLIYIAIRNDIVEKYGVEPEGIFKQIEENCTGNCQYILKDALSDIQELKAPRVKNTNEVDSEETGKKIDVNRFMNNSNRYLNLINKGRSIPFVFNHKARYLSDINYSIYERLLPGDNATDEKIADIMPYAHRNHCFKDKYYKLYADKPCRTITAHLRMDCHSHIHPTQVRALTPREAARVQSFPDDYLFLGAYLKTYMQIGNAVPPMMARGIAKVIKNYLE